MVGFDFRKLRRELRTQLRKCKYSNIAPADKEILCNLKKMIGKIKKQRIKNMFKERLDNIANARSTKVFWDSIRFYRGKKRL